MSRDDRGGWLRTCELCEGSGWADVTPEQAHRPNLCDGTPGASKGDGGCWCTAAQPCRCTTGLARRDVHQLVIERNDRR